ncbi:MAG: transglycosylase SLT domain-containing protein [Pseudomonadota bacterium]|nr:transglycosylase SLT domain-containing protein [Pseudomonadota bacterium]
MRTDKHDCQKTLAGKTQNTLPQAEERENKHRAALSSLETQIADIVSERDAACRQVELLETSLATANSRLEATEHQVKACQSSLQTPSIAGRFCWSLNWTVITAAAFLLLGALASATTFRNAQSTMQGPPQLIVQGDVMEEDVNASDSEAAAAADSDSGKQKKPPPQTRKRKTRFVKAGPAVHRQWGPPLYLQDAQAAKTRHLFDPLVKAQQEDLLTLGFDLGEADGFKGARTEQALDEFQSLYLSGAGLEEAPGPVELATLIKNYAKLARNDANRFNVDRGVVAAIRLSSVRTGVDFSYLMELAAAESNFDPVSKAKGSSAMGLYQFTRDTWLNTIKSHGGKYGLGDYASKIEFYVNRAGYQRPMVRDAAVYQHLLDLRMNPRLSAMMAAETVRDNLQRLTFSFDREPARTDLYLTHFLGHTGAISFLKALHENPDAFAGELFPAAAKSNQNIFHPKVCQPRTVNEVYELFGRKFNTSRYE